jgi:hypothetical protein
MHMYILVFIKVLRGFLLSSIFLDSIKVKVIKKSLITLKRFVYLRKCFIKGYYKKMSLILGSAILKLSSY